MRPLKIRWPLIIGIIAAALVIGAFAAYQTAIHTFKERVVQALGSDGEVKEIRVGLSGVEILDLRIKAPTRRAASANWPATEQLRASRILIVPTYIDLLVGKISIETLRIENASLAMLRTRDGKVRVLPSLLEPQASATAAPSSPAASGKDTPPEVLFNRIELVNGSIDFYDASVRTPPHVLRLEQINAAISRLRLPEMKGISTVDLVGTLKGVKQDGRVSISGTIEFATRELGMNARLRNVDLLALQPYLLKATESGVKRGTLDLDLNSSVKKNILHAPGTLTLKDLELGSASGTLMGMSRNAVISAMKRRDGAVTLRFVLDGNITDPRFSLNENLAKKLGHSLSGLLGVNMEGLAREISKLGGAAARGVGDGVGKLTR